jgi:hypothetical protein
MNSSNSWTGSTNARQTCWHLNWIYQTWRVRNYIACMCKNVCGSRQLHYKQKWDNFMTVTVILLHFPTPCSMESCFTWRWTAYNPSAICLTRYPSLWRQGHGNTIRVKATIEKTDNIQNVRQTIHVLQHTCLLPPHTQSTHHLNDLKIKP